MKVSSQFWPDPMGQPVGPLFQGGLRSLITNSKISYRGILDWPAFYIFLKYFGLFLFVNNSDWARPDTTCKFQVWLGQEKCGPKDYGLAWPAPFLQFGPTGQAAHFDTSIDRIVDEKLQNYYWINGCKKKKQFMFECFLGEKVMQENRNILKAVL